MLSKTSLKALHFYFKWLINSIHQSLPVLLGFCLVNLCLVWFGRHISKYVSGRISYNIAIVQFIGIFHLLSFFHLFSVYLNLLRLFLFEYDALVCLHLKIYDTAKFMSQYNLQPFRAVATVSCSVNNNGKIQFVFIYLVFILITL